MSDFEQRRPCLPIAIYARVSTEEQARWSIDNQVEMCKVYAAGAGLTPPDARVYVDVATGRDLQRPGMNLLLSERNLFGDVLVYKLDRLTRSAHDWFHLLEALHGPRGGRTPTILFQSQSIDLSRPEGRAMAAVVAVFAELERETISQRTADALARRRGRPGVYDSIKPLILELRKEGRSFREIAAAASLAVGKTIAHSTIKFLLSKMME